MMLINIGIIEKPIRWMTGFQSVIGLVYTYVLFMLFPVYNAVASLDTNQIEGCRGSRIALVGAIRYGQSCRTPSPASPQIGEVHAGGRIDPRADAAGLDHIALVHRDHPAMDVRIAGLEYRLGLRLPAALLIVCTVFVSVVMRLFRVKLSDIAK